MLACDKCSRHVGGEPATQCTKLRDRRGQANVSGVRSRPVRVACDEMTQLEVENLPGTRPHRATETPVDRCGGELDERTRLDERAESARVGVNVGVALGVCEHRLKSPSPKSQQQVFEPERPADVGKLEQQEGGVAAEAKPAQVRVRELERLPQRQLATGQDIDCYLLTLDLATKLGDEPLHGLGRCGIVVTNVRRCLDRRNAVRCGHAGNGKTLREVASSVVDSREHVRVKVDHGVDRVYERRGRPARAGHPRSKEFALGRVGRALGRADTALAGRPGVDVILVPETAARPILILRGALVHRR